MTPHYDVIVAGLGAAGSAALYQLARRGVKALGLDRFAPPHDLGSSHGHTRITRLALGEGDHYVQFARRSHEIWRELEVATGSSLLEQVGGLVFGPASGRTPAHGSKDFLQTTIDVARRHHISHEVLNAAALKDRFPQFYFHGDELGCLEHGAGFVRPEACIAAQLQLACRLGAQLHTGEQVMAWEPSGSGVRVTTDRGTHEAARLVLAMGAWLPLLVPPLASRTRVLRQVLFWFEPDGPHELFTPDRMPVYIRVPDARSEMFYGFPAIDGPGGGMKLAGEQFDRTVAPDEVERDVHPDEISAMHALAAPALRLSPRCLRSAVCKYTVTPDFDFVIDQHPGSDRVWMASACSGHGFKHSAAVGEALAELCVEGRSRFDLGAFRLDRWTAKSALR